MFSKSERGNSNDATKCLVSEYVGCGVGGVGGQGLSRYLETGCPNRGFIDFCVSKVWYKIHTTNKIDPYLYRFCFFRPDTALCVL